LTLDDIFGSRGAFLTAAAADLAGGTLAVIVGDAGISFSGSKNASDLVSGTQVLIAITDGGTIKGELAKKIDTSGGGGDRDFLVLGISGSDGGTSYTLSAGLAWFAAPEVSTGDFTLFAGETLNMDRPLTGQAASTGTDAGGSGWDGKSLTLTTGNAGTLILSTSIP
jgi:hypothetical protein